MQSRQLQLGIGRSYRWDVVRKATSGLGALMSWGPEKMLIRCSKESHHPAEWASGPPVEHQENKKDTTLTAIRVGVKIFQFLFGLQLPLTVKPHTTLLNLANKLRGKYSVKEVFTRRLLLRRYVYKIIFVFLNFSNKEVCKWLFIKLSIFKRNILILIPIRAPLVV